MDNDSQDNFIFRLSALPSEGIPDSSLFEEQYQHKMKYPLIQDTYYGIAILENYMDGDISAPEDIILDRIYNLLLRTLAIHPIGPMNKDGHPEFGWRCFEPIPIEGALTLEDNNVMFVSLKDTLEKTDIRHNLLNYKEIMSNISHKFEL